MKRLLSVAIMVKDEEERILRTLDTIIKHVSHVVILDTGSSDNTVNVIKKYCAKKKKPLKLDTVPFIDFSYNRNILLKMCYGLSEYVLLLDSNDEVVNPRILINFLNQVEDKRDSVFGCKFYWENDNGVEGNNRIYYKIGIIRNNIPDIYYESPVHEYITSSNPGKYISNNNLQLTKFYIYQNRLLDKSSIPRIKRDIDVLNKFIDEHEDNIRAYRFLCQSYNLLEDYDNLYKFALKMMEIIVNTSTTLNIKYDDNYYYSLMSLGCASYKIGLNTSEYTKYYLKAYQHARLSFDNCEPLYELASINHQIGNYGMAYHYIKKCIEIPMPEYIFDTQINNQIYEKHRWSLLLLLSEKLDHHDDYKLACKHLYGRDDLISLSSIKNNNSNDIKLTEKQKEKIINLSKTDGVSINQPCKTPEILKQNNAGYKLYLIVPYRDRLKHLVTFIPHMNKYLRHLEIDYSIIVSEQDDVKDFNKGILVNAAVKYISLNKKDSDQIYLCIHDINILPIKATNYYRPDSNTVDHLYGNNSSLDGILLINLNDFIKVNGFPNRYIGPSFEDNDFQRRVIYQGIQINTDYFFPRGDNYCFQELDPDTSPIKTNSIQQIFDSNQVSDEGFNTLSFDIKNYNIQQTIIRDPETKEPYQFNIIKYKQE